MEPNPIQDNINPPDQPMPPIMPKQKKQIPSWLGFVIIIVFAILVFGGVFAYQYLSNPFFCWPYCPNMTDKDREQIKSDMITAGWKTYSSTKYGYEIKYPELFDEPQLNITTGRMEFNMKPLTSRPYNYFYVGQCVAADQFVKKGSSNYEIFKGLENINGRTFYHYVNYPDNVTCTNISYDCTYSDSYRIMNGANCYELSYIRNSKNQNDVNAISSPKIINEVISTLKFTK